MVLYPIVLAVAQLQAERAGSAGLVVGADGLEAGNVLPPFGSTARPLTEQLVPFDPSADVVRSLDRTGSMVGENSRVRKGFVATIGVARSQVPDTALAASRWQDFQDPLVESGGDGRGTDAGTGIRAPTK